MVGAVFIDHGITMVFIIVFIILIMVMEGITTLFTTIVFIGLMLVMTRYIMGMVMGMEDFITLTTDMAMDIITLIIGITDIIVVIPMVEDMPTIRVV